MSHPLAILTPQFGAPSQTFVQKHVERLQPSRTVVVTQRVDSHHDGTWDRSTPVLELDRPGLPQRGIQSVARRLGWRLPNPSSWAVGSFLRKYGVKVVLGEHLDTSLDWLKIARSMGLRFFGHAHGYDVSERRLLDPRWRTEYQKYNDADGVITMSQFSRTRLIEAGLAPSHVHVVPYGVDVPKEPIVRPDRTTVRCLAVGRMVAKKAPITTLDAFRRAAEAHPQLHLDFVGAGPLLPAAEEFVRCLQLQSRVTLHGARSNPDVLGLMREADIFLQHSVTARSDGNQEGLPVAILEAMAQALPVVSTRHTGIPEAVEDGASGYLVEEGDSVRMADCILHLARESGLRRAMARAAWERARTEFTWEVERDRLNGILGLDEPVTGPA